MNVPGFVMRRSSVARTRVPLTRTCSLTRAVTRVVPDPHAMLPARANAVRTPVK